MKRWQTSNISKFERARRPVRPEFGWTGIIIGLVAGWVVGAGVELALGKPKMLIMAAAIFACVLVGGAVEGIRFLVQMRRYRTHRNS